MQGSLYFGLTGVERLDLLPLKTSLPGFWLGNQTVRDGFTGVLISIREQRCEGGGGPGARAPWALTGFSSPGLSGPER